jgi:hypothetical protein
MNITYKIASLLIEHAEKRNKVASGPFKGAKLIPSALEHDWNKLMGVYEFSLHDAIEDAIASRPPLVIDVGAAEGYYTLGLTHRLPESHHIAYELLDIHRTTLRDSLSDLDLCVEIKGECTPENLLNDLRESEQGLLIMDCEGAEQDLLNNEVLRALQKWHILLEVHDHQLKACAGDAIQEAFAESHLIAVSWSRDLTSSELKLISPWPLNILCRSALCSMLKEDRGCSMRFFYMTPKMI